MSQPAPPADPRQLITGILVRAGKGDATALPDLRKLLNNRELAQRLGDLARRLRGELIQRLAGTDLTLRETVGPELDRLRAELAGPNPSAFERMLVERVAVGWLQVHEADRTLSRRSVLPENEFLQKRADHAQRRFLAAVRALATVRKLALPALQVNIADQQVNVTG